MDVVCGWFIKKVGQHDLQKDNTKMLIKKEYINTDVSFMTWLTLIWACTKKKKKKGLIFCLFVKK